MHYIYRITHLKNKKQYIGITSDKYETENRIYMEKAIYKRFNQHKKANSLIGYSLRKYGEDYFMLECVSVLNSNDKQFVKLIESRLIKQYNTLSPHGYNDSFSANYLETYNLHEVDNSSFAHLFNINISKYGKFSFSIYRKENECQLIKLNNKWINKDIMTNKELRDNNLVLFKDNVKYIKQNTIESYNLLHIINCHNKIIIKHGLQDFLISYEDIQDRLNKDKHINYILTKSQLLI